MRFYVILFYIYVYIFWNPENYNAKVSVKNASFFTCSRRKVPGIAPPPVRYLCFLVGEEAVEQQDTGSTYVHCTTLPLKQYVIVKTRWNWIFKDSQDLIIFHGVPGELLTLIKYAIKTYFATFFVLVSSFQKYKNEKYLCREFWENWI